MAGQGSHAAAEGRDMAVGGDGAEQAQLLLGLAHAVGGWRREPGQRHDVGLTEGRYGQHHWREVGVENLGGALGVEAVVGGGGPETEADAGRHTPSPTSALPGHVVADAHGLEVAQPRGGVVDELAEITAVDDHAHALDGE